MLYEPYTETLSELIVGKQSISYKTFIDYLIEIIKILSHLADSYIFPDIEPSTVLLSNNSIKLKIRPCHSYYLESERDCVKQCGYYFSMLMSELTYSSATTPSKMVQGLNIKHRLEF